jgi:hypothetical protein
MPGPRPSADRLILRGYGPLAALLAGLLVVTMTVPSKDGGRADAGAGTAEQAIGYPEEEAAAAAAGGLPAEVPTAAADKAAAGTVRDSVPGATSASAAGRAAPGSAPRATARGKATALTPAQASAAAVGVGGVRRADNCAGGAKQDKISAYAPDCLAFTGDNGGATHRGVTADTILFAQRDSDGIGGNDRQPRDEEESELQQKASESGLSNSREATQRTFNTLLAYFNKHYQLYGRKVKVVKYTPRGDQQKEIAGGGQEAANADALKVAQEIKAFGALSATTQPYLDALVRQKVLSFGGLHLPAGYYKARAPYAWGQLIDCTTLMTSAVDLLAKRFPTGQNAVRAGSAKLREQPRKYGLLVPDDAVYASCINEARPQLKAAGIEFAKEIKYALDFAKLQQEAPNMAAQLKSAGVTTLVLVTDPLLPFFLTGAATQQDFWPEWFVTGTIGTDVDVAGQFYDADQWQFAYGQSYLTGFGEGKNGEGYRAYKSMRPNDEPSTTVDLTYQSLLQLFIGLQQAGPNLTPQSFARGMYAYAPHHGPFGTWSFDANDHTTTDDAREIYYDRKAISPFNGKPGRWVILNSGRRYTGATWPAAAPPAPIPPAAAP